MITSCCRLFLAGSLCWTSLAFTALAGETIPQQFRELQQKAPVVAVIETQRVTVKQLPPLADKRKLPGQDVTVNAKVIKVLKGGSSVKAGQIVTIRYTYKPKPVGRPGAPAPIPILAEGIQRTAYLTPRGNNYFEPAAFAYSFNKVPSQIPVSGGPVGN